VIVARPLKVYFAERGTALSCSTPYIPQTVVNVTDPIRPCGRLSNCNCTKCGWPEERWQDALQEALHSMRSLLCTATNETLHERMFRFQRRATFGTATPTRLLTEGPGLLRCHVRNKGGPLCDEVLLMESNPWCAHIQRCNGREDTVSTSDLAP